MTRRAVTRNHPPEWSNRDYREDREDVPGHTFHAEIRSYGFDVWCSCGWAEKAVNGAHLVELRNRHRIAVFPTAEHHDLTIVESGKYARVQCSCGWQGDWRFLDRADIDRALHSDENAHHFAIKRAREATQ